MSLIKTHYDADNASFRIDGHISQRDVAFNLNEAIVSIKRELVSSVVDHLMKKLGPKLDEAILAAFSDKEV